MSDEKKTTTTHGLPLKVDRPPEKKGGKKLDIKNAVTIEDVAQAVCTIRRQANKGQVPLPIGKAVVATPELRIINPVEIPEVPQGQYEILEYLGKGGMGLVIKARDCFAGGVVALKILLPQHGGLSTEQERDLVKEGNLARQLDHPNIVPLYNLGRAPKGWAVNIPAKDSDTLLSFEIPQGSVFLAMKFIKGSDLDEYLFQQSASLFAVLEAFRNILDALIFAHGKGIIHRDLKPENIKVENDTGRVLVLDLGLAKAKGLFDKIEVEALAAGTPGYMAPEQVYGRPTDGRTDLYTVGVMLYAVLSGAHPYPFEDDLVAYLEKTATEEPAPLEEQTPAIPGLAAIPAELGRIVRKAMAKNPDNRHQDAAEFKADLQAFQSGELAHAEADKHTEAARLAFASLVDQEEAQGKATARVVDLRPKVEAGTCSDKEEAEYWRTVDRLKLVLGPAVEELVAEVERELSLSLQKDPAHEQAKALRARYHLRHYKAALERNDVGAANRERTLAALYDTSRVLTDEIKGDGTFLVSSNPPGAEIFLAQLEERGHRFQPRREERLGVAPLTSPVSLPMGNYLLILRRNGYREVKDHVVIPHGFRWDKTINLYTEQEIGGAEFAYVPGGAFLAGGDAQSPGAKERERMVLGDFFLSRFPAINLHFFEFLNAIAPEEAAKYAPLGEGILWKRENGKFELLSQEFENLPVVNVSHACGEAYAKWRSDTDPLKRIFTLPNEWEVELAIGGRAGWRYPWGNTANRHFANCWGQFGFGKSRLQPITEMPAEDTSVFGVRAGAGGVSVWTSSVAPDAEGMGVLRERRWRYPINMGIRTRAFLPKEGRQDSLGFRLSHHPARP